MNKFRLGCAALVVIPILGGLLIGDEEGDARRAAGDAKIRHEVAIERSVKAILKDPESATFRHLGEHCGWVNAKNGFGGYTGFTRFIANPDGDAAIETETNHSQFQKLWNASC